MRLRSYCSAAALVAVYGPVYIGIPDEVIKMLEQELKTNPMTQMVFSMDSPGMDPRHMRSSLELFAKEVIPHFRNRWSSSTVSDRGNS